MLLKSPILRSPILCLCLLLAPALLCAQSWQSVNAAGTPPQYTDWTNTVFDTQHGTLLLTQDDSAGGSGIYADAVFSFNPTNGNWTQRYVNPSESSPHLQPDCVGFNPRPHVHLVGLLPGCARL
jgi:hypothetical protein